MHYIQEAPAVRAAHSFHCSAVSLLCELLIGQLPLPQKLQLGYHYAVPELFTTNGVFRVGGSSRRRRGKQLTTQSTDSLSSLKASANGEVVLMLSVRTHSLHCNVGRWYVHLGSLKQTNGFLDCQTYVRIIEAGSLSYQGCLRQKE